VAAPPLRGGFSLVLRFLLYPEQSAEQPPQTLGAFEHVEQKTKTRQKRRGERKKKEKETKSLSPESRDTAIGRPFARAMLSPRLPVPASVLALSGADAPAPPKGEPFHPPKPA